MTQLLLKRISRPMREQVRRVDKNLDRLARVRRIMANISATPSKSYCYPEAK